MNSLERSLQLGLVISLTILMFIFWWSVTLTSRMLSDNYVFSELVRQGSSLIVSLSDEQILHDEQSMLSGSLIKARLEAHVKAHPDQWVFVASGSDIWIAPESADLGEIPQVAPGQSMRDRHAGAQGEPILAWYAGYSFGASRYVVGKLQNVSAIADKLAVFQWFAALLAVLLLGVLLTVQRVIIRQSVEKLERIRRDMLRLEHGQAVALSEDVPSEVMPLVIEFNQLLRRFEQRLRQSRNAVGNLAHSLKGPLNLLIRSSGADSIGAAEQQQIAFNAQNISRLIDSELKRARLAGRGAVGLRFDVDAELPAIVGLLEQVYSDKRVSVEYEIDFEVELMHDRQDMLELFGNLLDNAVKWSHEKVLLSMNSSNGVIIKVEDDGPGCSPELIGRLTERGVRLDESVAGHGLGLSIVKDIVGTYSGQLTLERSARLGGLKVSVYLPTRGF